MDEPIAALDARLRETARVELKRLQRELQHTLVYVTHDQEEAMSVADRIAVMEQGRIRQIDTPEAIYRRPASRFVARTVGAPRINEIEGTHEGGRFAAGNLPLRLGFPGIQGSGPATVAIRPEDLDVDSSASGGESLEATVYEVEPLGGHTIVDLEVGKQILRVHLRGQPTFASRQKVGLRIDAAKAHLFDGESGKALAHPK